MGARDSAPTEVRDDLRRCACEAKWH